MSELFIARAQHLGSIGHFNAFLYLCPLEDLLSMKALKSLACTTVCEIPLSETSHFE